MSRALIDANVFLYALGGEHRYREPCRDLVARLARGELKGELSVGILQEVVHVRRRRGELEASERAREIIAWDLPVHGLELDDLDIAFRLLDQHPELRMRDAIHAGTAISRDIAMIVSADTEFDRLPGLERIDPTDSRGLERLTVAA